MASGPLTVKLQINADGSAAIVGLNKVKGALDATGQEAKAASGGFKALSSSLQGLALTAGAALSVQALASSFMAANIEASKLRAQLVTATGSVEGATKAWGALQAFAAKSPFTLAEATQAFVTLKNRGLDASISAMTSYGNSSAALGKSVTQMAEAVADAVNGDFARAEEAFSVNAQQNGDKVIMTFRGVATEINNTSADIQKYLQQIGNVDFAGGMARQGQTLAGVMSTLGDNWDQLMVTLGDTGSTSLISAAITEVSDKLNDLSASIEQGLPVGELGDQLAELEGATGGWGEAIRGIAPAWQAIFTELANLPNYVVSIRDGALAIEEQGTAWDSVKELIVAFGQAMIDLPDNLQKAVTIILGEIDILEVNFQAGMDSLPLYAQAAWAYIQNIILTAWVNIKIAVAEAVTWIAGRLASMATDMAGFFARVPAELDFGGMAAASAAQLTGLAASLNSTKDAVAGLKIEKVALGQAYTETTGKINGEIAAIQANGAAQTSTIRDNIEAGIADVDAKNQRRLAQVALNQEFALAVKAEADLNKGAALTMGTEEGAAKIKAQLAEQVRKLYTEHGRGVKQHQALTAAQKVLSDAEKAGIDVSKEKSAILKALKEDEANATGAKRAGAKASGEAAKAAKAYEKDLDALIKQFLPARADAEKLAEATDLIAKAHAKGDLVGKDYTEMVKKVAEAYDTATNDAQKLIDKYDTEGAKARELVEDRAKLVEIMANGTLKVDGAAQAMDKLTEAEKKNNSEADAWAEVWKNAVKRIDDTFANLWQDLFSGAKSTLDSLKRAITSWLAEVAHALITKPLVVAITAGMTGTSSTVGATGTTGATGTAGAGGYGNFLTGIKDWFGGNSMGVAVGGYVADAAKMFGIQASESLYNSVAGISAVPNWTYGLATAVGGVIGTAIWKNKGYSGIGATIGSTVGAYAGAAIAGAIGGASGGVAAGAAMGSIVPGIGTLIGAIIGGIAGGGLGSLFGGNKKPHPGAFSAVTNGNIVMLEDNVGSKGAFGLTFGMSDRGTKNVDAAELKEVFDGFAKVSEVLAEFYGKDVSAMVEASLKATSMEYYSKDGIIRYAMDVNEAFDVAFTKIIDAAAATGDSVAVVMKAVVGDLSGTAENMANQIETAMQTTTAVIAVAKALEGTDAGKILELGDDLTANALKLVDYARHAQGAGETIGQALARMSLNLTGLSTALDLSGQTVAATGTAFIDLARDLAATADAAGVGMAGLMQLQAVYFDQFFSDTAKFTRNIEAASKAITAGFKSLNLAVDLSVMKDRQAFIDLVNSIDLTTEAGRKFYVELMKLAPAFDAVFDGVEAFMDWLRPQDKAARAFDDLTDLFDKWGITMPKTREEFDKLVASGILTAEQMAILGGRLDALNLVFSELSQRASLLDFAEVLSPTNGASPDRIKAGEDAFRKAGYKGDLRDPKGMADFVRTIAALPDAGGEAVKELLKYVDTFDQFFDAIAAAAQQHSDLQLRLAEAQGDNALALRLRREQELKDALDDTNRALLKRIYALEDAKAAMNAAYAALERAVAAERQQVEEAYQARVDAINAEREAINAAHEERIAAINAEREALQTQISAAQEALSKIEGILGSVQSALDTIRGQLAVSDIALAAARRQLANWARQGVLPDQEAFDRVMGTLNRDDKGNYASANAYRANQQATYANLLELERLGLAQKTAAEKQLEALEAQTAALDAQITQADQIGQDQLDALDDQLKQADEWRAAELTRLDDLLEDAREKMEIALGTYAAVLSIDEALKVLNQTMVDYLSLRDQDQATTLGAAAQDPLPATTPQAAGFDSLRAEIIELRSVIATVGTAQITPLKSIDDRLRKFDTDGLPPGRDDVVLLRAA